MSCANQEMCPVSQPASVRHTRIRGAATVELALVLPILIFVFFAGADFSRAFYYSQILTEAANRGAQYASNADLAARSPFATVEDAVLSDLTNVKPTPTVSVTYGGDILMPTAQVTVTYEFKPFTSNFGLVSEIPIQRSALWRLHPSSDLPEGSSL